jgi:hypothetical protein
MLIRTSARSSFAPTFGTLSTLKPTLAGRNERGWRRRTIRPPTASQTHQKTLKAAHDSAAAAKRKLAAPPAPPKIPERPRCQPTPNQK